MREHVFKVIVMQRTKKNDVKTYIESGDCLKHNFSFSLDVLWNMVLKPS